MKKSGALALCIQIRISLKGMLAAVLDVPMDEIIVIDVNRTKQISA